MFQYTVFPFGGKFEYRTGNENFNDHFIPYHINIYIFIHKSLHFTYPLHSTLIKDKINF